MTDHRALDTLALRIMDATVTDEDERKLGVDGITKVVQGRIVRLLRSALTPTWTDTPEPLPEGATWGVYAFRYKEFPANMNTNIWSREDVQDMRGMTFMEYMGPLALLNKDRNPVAIVNGEVI
jgi:hypothetical protein